MAKSSRWAGAIECLEEGCMALGLGGRLGDKCTAKPNYLSTIDEFAACGLSACQPLLVAFGVAGKRRNWDKT
jgi:hypothetical protein